MQIKFRCLSLAVCLVFCLYQSVSAELAAVGSIDSTNGFPSSYTDENGLALGLCLASSNCVFDDPIAGNPFSQQIKFGEKAYYWSADAELTGTGAKGTLKLALVASFSKQPAVRRLLTPTRTTGSLRHREDMRFLIPITTMETRPISMMRGRNSISNTTGSTI
jgi:hypothetical protein